MNLLFTKELCMYMIDACDDYFLHHKLLMISKPYYIYCINNKEQRQYDLICKFQYIEFSLEYELQTCTYKVNGIIHQIDNNLPSLIRADGTKKWFQNGELHRDNDLPAMLYASGTQKWYLNDRCHRDNGLPAVIFLDGSQFWFLNGKCHRDNGPAIIDSDGSQFWYLNGKRHRDNGPAIMNADGYQEWYLHDKFIKRS